MTRSNELFIVPRLFNALCPNGKSSCQLMTGNERNPCNGPIGFFQLPPYRLAIISPSAARRRGTRGPMHSRTKLRADSTKMPRTDVNDICVLSLTD